MAIHNKQIADTFSKAMQNCEDMSESLFQETMNQTIVAVELEERYDAKQKLKIYSLMTYLSNCGISERKKYVKKVVKCL